jgi:type IV secretory pathway VirD2 relaxase
MASRVRALPASFTTKVTIAPTARRSERGEGDRHQFRFIVMAEDSAELADLKPFVRDLMRQMETDLGTRLDWVAADHFNTGHPHSHIVVRGKDDRGRDLVIARDYVAYGMPARAGELIIRQLGPESELDQLRKLEQEVAAERFTRLDRGILRGCKRWRPCACRETGTRSTAACFADGVAASAGAHGPGGRDHARIVAHRAGSRTDPAADG